MQTSEVVFKTPLTDQHVRAGAKMIEFGGWMMPVQYVGILAEHHSVRNALGLFDLCHMGQIRISGTGALEFVQTMTTNDASKIATGQAQYSLLCNQHGGVLDDILVYRLLRSYLLVVNAANAESDYQWLLRHSDSSVHVENMSKDLGMLSIQGPLSQESLASLTGADLATLPYYHCVWSSVAGIDTLVSRTGYTGEHGFELIARTAHVEALWSSLLNTEPAPQPCGLGARDLLRLEAAMPLYGHELTEEVNPFEAGLGRVVKLTKPHFIGKLALEAAARKVLSRKLACLELADRAVARVGFAILQGDLVIGSVTSGGYSPTSGTSIAMGYLATKYGAVGSEVSVVIRDRIVRAHVVGSPFYQRMGRR